MQCEWLLQTSVPHKTCHSNFTSSPSTQQDGYDSDSDANSESESEAASEFDYDTESDEWMNLELMTLLTL
ncbi:hypothetical protein SPONN_545 [uncultured Candidatus Thioglobus sp.]|nr:hypothetical protein SPONN_545 [uncultured Candidatus Thioglobus sp.]